MQTERSYTCFFITPIGSEGSPERKNSDDVMKRLIFPALKQCGFKQENIIRSDKEDQPGLITSRIEAHIQNDDLCIVDLTGLNSNVMYEYGMRKGLGKPFIAMRKKGEPGPLPFDISGENTLHYDVESVDALLDAQDRLTKMVQHFADQGFVNSEGEGSIKAITARLRSIEDKLNAVLTARESSTGNNIPDDDDVSGNVNSVIRKLGGALPAFKFALQSLNIALGEALMPRLAHEMPKDRYIDTVVATLTALGSEKAATILRMEWDYIKENFSFKQQFEELGCYVNFCNRQDCEPENLDFLLSAADNLFDLAETKEDKAQILNQINRIYHGAYATLENRGENHPEYLDKAIQALEKAIKLDPDKPHYYHNLAICFREKGDTTASIEAAAKCIELDSKVDDHLELAYKIFKDNGDPRAAIALEKLRKVNPLKASMLD